MNTEIETTDYYQPCPICKQTGKLPVDEEHPCVCKSIRVMKVGLTENQVRRMRQIPAIVGEVLADFIPKPRVAGYLENGGPPAVREDLETAIQVLQRSSSAHDVPAIVVRNEDGRLILSGYEWESDPPFCIHGIKLRWECDWCNEGLERSPGQ